MKNDGGPAFPRSGFEASPEVSCKCDTLPQAGMSLRDWFAGQALIGLLAAETKDWNSAAETGPGQQYAGKEPGNLLALGAFAIADAMLAQRAKA
jgi:hypothetical protein